MNDSGSPHRLCVPLVQPHSQQTPSRAYTQHHQGGGRHRDRVPDRSIAGGAHRHELHADVPVH